MTAAVAASVQGQHDCRVVGQLDTGETWQVLHQSGLHGDGKNTVVCIRATCGSTGCEGKICGDMYCAATITPFSDSLRM